MEKNLYVCLKNDNNEYVRHKDAIIQTNLCNGIYD